MSEFPRSTEIKPTTGDHINDTDPTAKEKVAAVVAKLDNLEALPPWNDFIFDEADLSPDTHDAFRIQPSGGSEDINKFVAHEDGSVLYTIKTIHIGGPSSDLNLYTYIYRIHPDGHIAMKTTVANESNTLDEPPTIEDDEEGVHQDRWADDIVRIYAKYEADMNRPKPEPYEQRERPKFEFTQRKPGIIRRTLGRLGLKRFQ